MLGAAGPLWHSACNDGVRARGEAGRFRLNTPPLLCRRHNPLPLSYTYDVGAPLEHNSAQSAHPAKSCSVNKVSRALWAHTVACVPLYARMRECLAGQGAQRLVLGVVVLHPAQACVDCPG